MRQQLGKLKQTFIECIITEMFSNITHYEGTSSFYFYDLPINQATRRSSPKLYGAIFYFMQCIGRQ